MSGGNRFEDEPVTLRFYHMSSEGEADTGGYRKKPGEWREHGGSEVCSCDQNKRAENGRKRRRKLNLMELL